MSIENHPNIHAIKLMLATFESLKSSLRGPAEKNVKNLEFFLLNESRKFAIHISEKLDEMIEEETGSYLEKLEKSNDPNNSNS